MWGDMYFYWSGRKQFWTIISSPHKQLQSTQFYWPHQAASLQLRFAALINKKLSVWNIVRGGVLLIILPGGGNDDGISPAKLRA
jgi:hypothetical protein